MENMKLEYNGISANTSEISEAGLAYLLAYGWAKSLQDSVAGRKKALMAGDAEKEIAPLDEDEADAKLVEMMTKRAQAICDGEVGHRAGGPRISKLDRVMRTVAAEIIRAAAAAKGKKLPKGDAYQALVSAYVAKNEAAVKAEAERRMAISADDADDILGDLLD